jgi:anti-anti-sigma factor
MSSSPRPSESSSEPVPPTSATAALEAEVAALRQELNEVRVLNRIVGAVSTARESATAFERACEELAQAFAVPQVALAALDASQGALHVVAEYCAPGRPSGMGEIIPVANNPIVAYITAHHAPLAISDVRADPRVSAVRDLFARRGTQAILIAPVFAKDVLIGTVGMDAIEPRSFSEREIALAQAISDAISQGLYNLQLYEAVQRELATRLRAEQVIREQATVLAQLSTPLIPISERMLILPLIGELDAARAEHVLRTLLQGIEQQRAEVLIIDITGIPIVDTHVAGTLLQAVRAAQLLGTETMITGIRPEVAQTLVNLGADLRGVRTFGTLRSAVSHAFGRR